MANRTTNTIAQFPQKKTTIQNSLKALNIQILHCLKVLLTKTSL